MKRAIQQEEEMARSTPYPMKSIMKMGRSYKKPAIAESVRI